MKIEKYSNSQGSFKGENFFIDFFTLTDLDVGAIILKTTYLNFLFNIKFQMATDDLLEYGSDKKNWLDLNFSHVIDKLFH